MRVVGAGNKVIGVVVPALVLDLDRPAGLAVHGRAVADHLLAGAVEVIEERCPGRDGAQAAGGAGLSRAAWWPILTIRSLPPLPRTVISRCHRSMSRHRRPASSDSRMPVAMIPVSRRWVKLRPAHACSSRVSSSSAKTGTSLAGRAAAPARPSGQATRPRRPTHPALRRERAGYRRRAASGVVYPPAVPGRGRGLGEPHRRLCRRCPAPHRPRLAHDPGPPRRDHPCARRQPHHLGEHS